MFFGKPAVGSQVIEVLEAQEVRGKKETGKEKGDTTADKS
jgi:hypothetical protein